MGAGGGSGFDLNRLPSDHISTLPGPQDPTQAPPLPPETFPDPQLAKPLCPLFKFCFSCCLVLQSFAWPIRFCTADPDLLVLFILDQPSILQHPELDRCPTNVCEMDFSEVVYFPFSVFPLFFLGTSIITLFFFSPLNAKLASLERKRGFPFFIFFSESKVIYIHLGKVGR